MKNIVLKISFIFFFLIILCSCNQQAPIKIVWYLSNPMDYGFERSQLTSFQELESKRFDLFNKRLKELGINAHVVFKYYEREISEEELIDMNLYMKNELLFPYQKVKYVTEHDKDADLIDFSPYEYHLFEPLDTYYANNEVLKNVLPEKLLKVNQIKGKLYQLPKGNVSIKQNTYYFNKQFLNDYDIHLNEEIFQNKTIKEIIELFLPYFKENNILNNQYYLSSFEIIKPYFNQYINLNLYTSDYSLMINPKNNEILNLFELPQYQELLEIAKLLYENNLDLHLLNDENIINVMPIFYVNTYPTLPQLSNQGIDDSLYVQYRIDEPILSHSLGNGILKISDNKDLASQVLLATMSDKILSDLMIYGIENEDYYIYNQRAITNSNVSNMGSFSQIGNNFIATPNSKEVLNKKEISFQLIEDLELEQSFYFTLEHDMLLNFIDIQYFFTNYDIASIEKMTIDEAVDEITAKLKKLKIDSICDAIISQYERE